MAKLKQIQNPTIDPDLITLIFPDDKKYAWRRENDITIDPNDTAHPLYSHCDERVLLPVSDSDVADVRSIGVYEPVVLFERDGRILVQDGIQRIKRRRLANTETELAGEGRGNVPYVAKQTADDSQIGYVRTSLNAHRVDDDYSLNARNCKRRMEAFNWTVQQAAQAFNVSVTAIKQWLSFLDLAPQVVKAVEKKKIAPTTALSFKLLPHDQQVDALNDALASVEGVTLKTNAAKPKQLSGKEAKKTVQAKAGKAEQTEEEAEAAKTKAFHKAVASLMAMEPLDRIKVLQIFDPTTGEEIALATRISAVIDEVEAEPDKDDVSAIYTPEKTDDETRELTTEYDDQITEAEGQPTVKRRSKKASSRK